MASDRMAVMVESSTSKHSHGDSKGVRLAGLQDERSSGTRGCRQLRGTDEAHATLAVTHEGADAWI